MGTEGTIVGTTGGRTRGTAAGVGAIARGVPADGVGGEGILGTAEGGVPTPGIVGATGAVGDVPPPGTAGDEGTMGETGGINAPPPGITPPGIPPPGAPPPPTGVSEQYAGGEGC